MLGWLVCAVVTGVGLQRTDPVTGGRDALAHLAFAIGHLLGLGGVVAAWVGAYRLRASPGQWGARLAIAALGATAASFFLADDLSGFAARHAEAVPPGATIAVFSVAAGLLLVIGVEIGRVFRSRAGRVVAIVATGAALWFEPRVLTGQYPGLHLFAVLGAASFAGSALRGAPLPRWIGERPRVVVAALGALGLLAFVIPASDQVRFLVARDGDVVAPFAGRLGRFTTASIDGVSAPRSEWLVARADRPDVPPSLFARSVRNPIVLLVTIDCMRFDTVGGRRPRARMPNLAKLRAEGAFFIRAQAPGTSTVFSLTSLFSGKYYSQLEWSRRRAAIFPPDDQTPRFPALLTEAGVWTVHAASFNWLKNERGVARGFEVVDYDAMPGPRWKPMEPVIEALVGHLAEVGERPAFFYAHINDTHGPYTRGGPGGSLFARYLRILELVDRQIGRLLEAVDRLGLSSRAFVIVTADHGEAFGEHRRKAHGNSLYQELAHVPLIVHGPGISPTKIATRVSLMDLGPTILDLFGLPTPATFMGESLYPALVGKPFAPTRPILAQVGSLRSLVTPSGLKVIRDTRRGTVEAYDLESDPRELRSLLGEDRADVREALRTLDAFFEVHQFRREGYVEPYRAF